MLSVKIDDSKCRSIIMKVITGNLKLIVERERRQKEIKWIFIKLLMQYKLNNYNFFKFKYPLSYQL